MSLQGVPLLQYNPAMPDDLKNIVIAGNSNGTRQILSKQGITLTQVNLTDVLTYNSTAYVEVTQLAKAFDCSGGRVKVTLQSAWESDNSSTAKIALYVDKAKVKETVLLCTGGVTVIPLCLTHIFQPSTGNHLIQVYIKSSAGNTSLGFSNANTTLDIEETRI